MDNCGFGRLRVKGSRATANCSRDNRLNSDEMAKTPHILVAEARYYVEIADELLKGATSVLSSSEATFEIASVPGAFELPSVVRMAIESGGFDGYVTLGCVIRGETSHYDIVSGESARGLMFLSTEFGIALGYGILTTETQEQAWVRASRSGDNKGGMAAQTCLEMVVARSKFGKGSVRG